MIEASLDAAPVSRSAVRLAAHRLLAAVEGEPRPPRSEALELAEIGDDRRWPEVSVVARGVSCLLAAFEGEAPGELTDDLIHRADASGDAGLIAMALALRSWAAMVRATSQGLTIAGARTDLAVAVVALEQARGGVLERVMSHCACGAALALMDLWELALEQYAAAAAVDLVAEEPDLGAHATALAALARSILHSRIEIGTNYACDLCIAGEQGRTRVEVASVVRDFETVKADAAAWPRAWFGELEACALVAGALAGEDVSIEAAASCAQPEPWLSASPGLASASGAAVGGGKRVGYARLALALSLASIGSDAAKAVAESAIATLPGSPRPLLTVAMDLAARLEGAPAALRLAEIQTTKLWTGRRRSVDSMNALIRAERLRAHGEELERHAHVDDLTGLANRRGFYRYLNELLADKRSRVSLLVVDIDRFKEVNDRYGHPVGDRVLRRLAAVLSRLVRPRDLAARLGGDEFFLLLEGTGTQVAIERARTIVAAVAEPDPETDGVALSVSIGVASGAPDEFDRVLAEADNALYRAKSTGGGRWVSAAAQSTTNQ